MQLYRMTEADAEWLRKNPDREAAWDTIAIKMGFDVRTVTRPENPTHPRDFLAEPTVMALAVGAIKPELLSLENIDEWAAMVVKDDAGKALCSERMDLIYTRRQKLEEDLESITKPLNHVIKLHRDKANPVLKLLTAAYDKLNRTLGSYQRETKEREEAEQRRKQKEEADRIKAEADRKLAEGAKTGNVELVKEAEKENRQATIIETAPVVVKQKAEVESGAKYIPVTRWYARVVDAAKIPRDFLIPDEKALGRLATAMKEKAKVDGVEFYSETTNQRKAS